MIENVEESIGTIDNLILEDYKFPVKVELYRKKEMKSIEDILYSKAIVYKAGTTEAIDIVIGAKQWNGSA